MEPVWCGALLLVTVYPPKRIVVVVFKNCAIVRREREELFLSAYLNIDTLGARLSLGFDLLAIVLVGFIAGARATILVTYAAAAA